MLSRPNVPRLALYFKKGNQAKWPSNHFVLKSGESEETLSNRGLLSEVRSPIQGKGDSHCDTRDDGHEAEAGPRPLTLTTPDRVRIRCSLDSQGRAASPGRARRDVWLQGLVWLI